MVVAVEQDVGERVLHAGQSVVQPNRLAIAVGDAPAAFRNERYVAPRVLRDERDAVEDLGEVIPTSLVEAHVDAHHDAVDLVVALP